MKEILEKLAKGENKFDCQYLGQPNVCKILMVDLRVEKVFVRFEKPIKKIERREVKSHSKLWSLDMDLDIPMEDVEVESYEEWISVNDK